MNQLSNSLKLTVASLLLALCSLPAWAEIPKETTLPDPDTAEVLPGAARPGSDPLQLLQVEEVQQELKLTPEQIEQLDRVDTEVRARLNQRSRGMNSRAALEKQVQQAQQQVADVLEPNQLERFREILLQVNGWAPEAAPPSRARGGVSLQNPIELNAQQEEQLADLQEDTQQQIGSNFSRSRSSDPEAICQTVDANRERIEPILQASQERALAALTEEQRATLEELKGEPFELADRKCQP